MNKIFLALAVTMVLLISGCNDKGDDMASQNMVKEIEVAPVLVDCIGVAPMECLSVREVGQTDWQLYYDSIEGFDFEPGYNYKLKINQTELDQADVPADASSIRWQLIEVLDKSPAK